MEQRLTVQNCTVNQPRNICGSVGFPVLPHLNHRNSGCHVTSSWGPQLGSPISLLGSGFWITFDRHFGVLWTTHAESLQSCLNLCDPHGPWPSRLLCPWDSPGKNIGVSCHFLLHLSKTERLKINRMDLNNTFSQVVRVGETDYLGMNQLLSGNIPSLQ